MSKVILHYFDTAGRAEMIRLAFKIGEVPFVDHRVDYKTWNNDSPHKAAAPTGMLPYLEFSDGTTIVESMACLIYAATLAGLMPIDPVQAAFAEQAAHLVDGSLDKIRDLFDPGCDRAKIIEDIKTSLRMNDRVIGRTMSSQGLTISSQLTFADLLIYTLLFKAFPDHVPELPLPVIHQIVPNLYKIGETVANHPKVAAVYAA